MAGHYTKKLSKLVQCNECWNPLQNIRLLQEKVSALSQNVKKRWSFMFMWLYRAKGAVTIAGYELSITHLECSRLVCGTAACVTRCHKRAFTPCVQIYGEIDLLLYRFWRILRHGMLLNIAAKVLETEQRHIFRARGSFVGKTVVESLLFC